MIGGIIGGWGGYGKFTPGQAFMLVFISGLVFLMLSLIKIKGKTFRELAFDGMPISVRSSISVGIGLFIAYIGFQNAGVILYNGYTQVSFVDFSNWGDQTVNALVAPWAAAKTAAVALVGLFLITILDKFNVKGAMIGTSTVTTFVESGSGVSAGGRTGLTAFTAACLFFSSMFVMPIFAAIPSAAAASALIYVGVLMMKNNIKGIDFTTHINATSAFLTISVMVLSYSITKGIGVGMLSYTLMSVFTYLIRLIISAVKKTEKPVFDVSAVAIIVLVLFAIYFFVPVTLF